MKKFRILYRVLKITGMVAAISGFLLFFVIATFAIVTVEPNITTLEDAAWYLFASFTTIGYGDFTAVTLIGRAITVVVSLYGMLIVAFIPAVVISYYTEFNGEKKDGTVAQFMDQLEHLSSLSKEELDEISKSIKKERYKL